MTSETAAQFGIVPNLAHQSAEERARDAPRLPFLMKLNLLVEARGITSFEDLLQAKTEVEKELEVGKQKDLAEDKENDVESEERLPEEPKAKKAKKSPKIKGFPNLVRRNARRGMGVLGGETWTEEIVMG
ncbi:Gag-pol polyprotein [Caenorhabditis elegans]|uniref:Gag-pol polyprotein n=1 Tax=Caenorhabditis elegans TaxID=6239 RepID=O16893_CAEEL|nr:Gag-pol polyprotein [Caenorhabditis elegans]CCD69366.1 Gag-pol polyprotein [Caenorhabditis elegans]|eukprot:NP_504210.1 Uncharacterized protein CELE_F13A2.4 [Caenorhabditis elegans]